MIERSRIRPGQYPNLGALLWFVGFLVRFTRPDLLSPRAAGYVYGAFALVGGVSIGIGSVHANFPVPGST